MLNEIIKGVAMKLDASFGDGYKIYLDDVKQGLKLPCFFIFVLKPELEPLLGTRKLSRNPLDIQYMPKEPGNNVEMYSVAGTLTESLEFVTLPNGDLLHGTSMTYEIVDGVLHFFVNYNLTLVKPTDEDEMDTVEVFVGTQGG